MQAPNRDKKVISYEYIIKKAIVSNCCHYLKCATVHSKRADCVASGIVCSFLENRSPKQLDTALPWVPSNQPAKRVVDRGKASTKLGRPNRPDF